MLSHSSLTTTYEICMLTSTETQRGETNVTARNLYRVLNLDPLDPEVHIAKRVA